MSTFRLSRPRGVLIHINFQTIFNGSFKNICSKKPSPNAVLEKNLPSNRSDVSVTFGSVNGQIGSFEEVQKRLTEDQTFPNF